MTKYENKNHIEIEIPFGIVCKIETLIIIAGKKSRKIIVIEISIVFR